MPGKEEDAEKSSEWAVDMCWGAPVECGARLAPRWL